jgi:ubiquinone/menaquinone biosynthesis C-methylase UbiE
MADIDEIMSSCGLESLHPGGIDTTDQMARMCRIGEDRKVLDIGAGKGVTACYLAEKYECEVIGVDLSERMVESAQERAKKRGSRVIFTRTDAHHLPFKADSFDLVLIECTTTLLANKEQAVSEFLRVAEPSGYIGDLEMVWQKAPPKELVESAGDVWEGFTTMTLQEWKRFYERMGMVDVKAVDFSETIPSMEKVMKQELGFWGLTKMAFKLLLRSDLRRAMNQSHKMFKDYVDYIGYGYVVGRKTGN